jgi:Glutathione S-transferase, N-terminal domain
MIDLYFWPTGNGKKTVILLEELGLPYTIKPINIGRGDQLTPEFLKISPNGRMPAIVDDEPMGGGAPISLFESGPIMMYLAEKTGRFCPQDPRGKYDVAQWVGWHAIVSRHGEGCVGHLIHADTARGRLVDREGVPGQLPPPIGARDRLPAPSTCASAASSSAEMDAVEYSRKSGAYWRQVSIGVLLNAPLTPDLNSALEKVE